MAIFYGQVKDDTFRKQMKENRKIEELIMIFVSKATNALKTDPSLVGDAWKAELNNQVGLFVKLLRDCMRTISHVSPELTQRLDMYTAKLTPPTPASDSGYDSASTSRDRRDSTVPTSPRVSGSVSDMPLVLSVARLFKIPEHAVQGEVEQMSNVCTQKVSPTNLIWKKSYANIILGCTN